MPAVYSPPAGARKPRGNPSELPGVPIFLAGTHRGKSYSVTDLDEMIRNFSAHCEGARPRMRVPAVLGHEESQDLLARSDLPAAAWVKRLYRRGPVLVADFMDVPPQVMKLLRGRAYRTVSAEVYNRPPEGLVGRGKMLRRVAFLGGDIPQIKTLGDIPLPDEEDRDRAQFCEGRPYLLSLGGYHTLPTGQFAVFTEVMPMDRQKMLEALAQHGVDTSAIDDTTPDSVLAEMLRVCEAKSQEKKPEAPPGDTTPDYMEYLDKEEGPPDWPVPRDDQEKNKYRERARRHYEHARRHYEKYCHTKKMGERPADPDRPDLAPGDDEARPMKHSEIQALVQNAVKEVLQKEVQGGLQSLTKFKEETLAAEKKRAVEAFCERMSLAGKLPPSEKVAVKARLLRADSLTVHKFTEAGKEIEGTELDLQMRELEQRPSRFGEQFKDPAPSDQSGEKQAAEMFYDRNSQAFSMTGTSKDEFLKLYDKADPQERKRLIGLSA